MVYPSHMRSIKKVGAGASCCAVESCANTDLGSVGSSAKDPSLFSPLKQCNRFQRGLTFMAS
jgi:hypothetical protein